jgi:hypothetical protein
MSKPNDPQQNRLAQILELLSPGSSQPRSDRAADDDAIDLASVSQASFDRAAAPTAPPVVPEHERAGYEAAGQASPGETPAGDDQSGLTASIQNLISYLRSVFAFQGAPSQNQQQGQQASATEASSVASGAQQQQQQQRQQQQQQQEEREQAADEPRAAGLGAILQALREMNAKNSEPQPGNASGDGSDRSGLGSLARSAAAVTAAFTALGASLTFLNRRFTSMARNTLELNGVLAEYNGTIAQANALAEAAGIERAIAHGQQLGPAYARLSAAQSEYRDIQQDFAAPIQSLGITITAALAEQRNSLLRKLEPVMDRIGELARQLEEWLGTDPNSAVVLGSRAFLSDVSDGKFDGLGTTYLNPGNTPLMSDADRRSIFGP